MPQRFDCRPTKQDLDALAILLDNESLADKEAEFLEDLKNWEGPWTVRQLQWFDDIWDKYEGGMCFK